MSKNQAFQYLVAIDTDLGVPIAFRGCYGLTQSEMFASIFKLCEEFRFCVEVFAVIIDGEKQTTTIQSFRAFDVDRNEIAMLADSFPFVSFATEPISFPKDREMLDSIFLVLCAISVRSFWLPDNEFVAVKLAIQAWQKAKTQLMQD